MDIAAGWRWLPLSGVLLMGVLVAWRVVLQHRRYGGSGLALFRGDWRSRLSDAGGIVVLIVLTTQAAVAALQPERLLPLFEPFRFAGASLLLVGLALMFAAQLNMAQSWRIGIDEDA